MQGFIDYIYRVRKTSYAFKRAVHDLSCEAVGIPIQTAFFEPNAISIIEALPWMRGKTLIQTQLERHGQQFSIRNLTGLWAGKTPNNVEVDTFLEYGYALKPAHQYKLPNRIGYETDEDFAINCDYLRRKLSWIADTEDGIPIVRHRTWDNTYYLINVDGGNHFASVYRQSIDQNRDFVFPCRIEQHRLDMTALMTAIQNIGLLILKAEYAVEIARLVSEFGSKFRPYHREFQKGKTVLAISFFYFHRGKELYDYLLEVLPSNSYFNLGEYLLNISSKRNL